MAGLALPAVGRAQLITTLVDREGVSFPCVTVGPLAPIAEEYCVRRSLRQGFLLKSERGESGLTLGTQGGADGVVTAVQPGSPAAAAGLAVGDRLVSVDGQAVRRPAGEAAERMSFGAAGEPVRLTLRRDGAELERTFKRAPAPEPPGTPKSPNFLIGMHPMVNWRGEFIPCMGAGVLGPAAVAACLSHYGKDGFVRVGALGATGLSYDPARTEAAVVMTVAPGSPAAEANVRPGDVVTAVDGQPLSTELGRSADSLLFGKTGATHLIVADRGGRPVQAQVTLAAR